MTISFFHVDQFKGSLGSSEGCGARTMWEFLPVPCLRPPVRASEWAASSLSRTVPGTWGSLWSRSHERRQRDKGSGGHAFENSETHIGEMESRGSDEMRYSDQRWTNNNTLAVSAPVPYICPSIASPICTTGLPPEKRGTTASPIAGPVVPIGQPRLKIVSTTN